MDAASQIDLRVAQIQAWLQLGATIEEPVLQRSAYYGPGGRMSMFEVVINRGGERQVIALGDDPAVYAFLKQHRLSVLDVS